MKKQLFLLFLLTAFCLHAFAQTKAYLYEDENKFAGGWFYGVSNSGRFVVGTNAANTIMFKLDTKTGITEQITSYGFVDAFDVSDAGVIAGKYEDPTVIIHKKLEDGTIKDEPAILPGIYKDGQWIAVERAEVLAGDGYDGRINSISADGKIMGGYIPTTYIGKDENGKDTLKASMTKFQPVIWGADGKIIQKLPFYTSGQGAILKSVSDDGTVACGAYDGTMYGDIIIWKNGERVNTKNYIGFGNVVSANGRFVGGACGKGMVAPHNKPFIWSEENGLVVSEDVPAETTYGEVTGITDDGKIAVGFVDLADMTAKRHPIIIIDGVYYNFDEWISDNYGLKGPYQSSFWAISSISTDGNVMCGIGYYDGARMPWVVVLDESKVPSEIPDGIDKVAQELDVNVAFNAAANLLNIQGEYTSAGLYNTVGACVLTDNQAEGTIDVSGLHEGIYLAKVMKGKIARTFKVAITR